MASNETLRNRFVKEFPNVFRRRGLSKAPLKIGIAEDIAARLPDLSLNAIKEALADYTGGPTYLQNMILGRPRFDLDGHLTSFVSLKDAKYARKRLTALHAKWAREDNSTSPEKDDTMCGSSISRSAFVRDETAPDIAPGLSTAEGAISLIELNLRSGRRDLARAIIADRDQANVLYGRRTMPSEPATSSVLTPEAVAERMKKIVTLLPDKKIEAIKEARRLFPMSLRDAKEWVEDLARDLAHHLPESLPAAPVERFISDRYLVLRRRDGDSGFERVASEGVLSAAEMEARAILNFGNDRDEVMVVEVRGRTKSTLEMLSAA